MFLRFINELPNLIPQRAENLGYADDFKVRVQSQKVIDEAVEVENWLTVNQIQPSIKRSHVLNVKGAFKYYASRPKSF